MGYDTVEDVLSSNETYDVIIIGGGAAGSACAALLSKWNLKILLVEKRGHLGGRASTLNTSFGYKIDTGVHGIPCYDLGNLKKIETELELQLDLIDYKPLLAFYDAEEKINVEVFDFSNNGFKEVNRIWSPNNEFLQLLNYLRNATDEDANKLDSISVADFIQQFSPTHQFYQLIRAINGMITIEPHLGSAGEFVRSFSQLFSSKRPITYPRNGGIQSLSELFGTICKKNGGRVLVSTKVLKILIEDGKISGVKCQHLTKDGESIEFDVHSHSVIVTIPLQYLFTIISDDFFSENFTQKVLSLKDKQSCAQGIAFTFKEELLDDFPWNPKCWGAIIFQPGKRPRYLSVPSALVENITPPGMHYLFYGVVATPDEVKDKKKSKERLKELKRELYQLFPRLKDLKEWQFAGSSDMVLGTAKRVGMTGDYKPGNKSDEIEGLFFAGDTVAGNGPGLECTYDSALKCSKLVLDWINEYRNKFDNEMIND
ncbi:MAG: phytoene desaturase family protein [Candidatus Helarchaeota archaeon]